VQGQLIEALSKVGQLLKELPWNLRCARRLSKNMNNRAQPQSQFQK